jgi:hypothetical protein
MDWAFREALQVSRQVVIVERLWSAEARNNSGHADSHLTQGRGDETFAPILDPSIRSAMTATAPGVVVGADLTLDDGLLQNLE